MVGCFKAVLQASDAMQGFQEALKVHAEQLVEDPVVHTHLSALYDTLLEQNLIRLIEPFSCVQINHLAELIKLPLETVLSKLAQACASSLLRVLIISAVRLKALAAASFTGWSILSWHARVCILMSYILCFLGCSHLLMIKYLDRAHICSFGSHTTHVRLLVEVSACCVSASSAGYEGSVYAVNCVKQSYKRFVNADDFGQEVCWHIGSGSWVP